MAGQKAGVPSAYQLKSTAIPVEPQPKRGRYASKVVCHPMNIGRCFPSEESWKHGGNRMGCWRARAATPPAVEPLSSRIDIVQKDDNDQRTLLLCPTALSPGMQLTCLFVDILLVWTLKPPSGRVEWSLSTIFSLWDWHRAIIPCWRCDLNWVEALSFRSSQESPGARRPHCYMWNL